MLTEHGISPEEDTQYYRFLLKLSLDSDPDWWVKYEREKARVAAAGGLGGRSPLRSAVSLVGQSASVTRSAMRRGPSPYGQPPPREDAREFARDLRHVRRRVMDEYSREREVSSRDRGSSRGTRAGSHRKKGSVPFDDDAYDDADGDEDPAERGYADFKLTAAAFRVWIRHASSLRALRTAREAAVENWMISVSFWECNALKRALACWLARHNATQQRALRFWYGKNLHNRFRYWKERTCWLRAERAAEAFATWRTAIAATNNARQEVLVVASAKRRERALRAWSAEAARRAALRRLGSDVATQAAHRLKALFYVKWRSAFHERARQKALLAGVVARFRNRRLVAAFNSWADTASSASLEREKLRAIAARLMHGSATRCLRAWLGFVDTMQREKECFERVKALRERRLARFGWTSWREAYALRLKMRRTMHRVMARLAMRAVSGAMFRWKEFVEETKHMRSLMQRVSMALTKRCMVSAFARWTQKMDEAAEVLAAAQRIIGRMRYGAAWAKWREKVAEAIEHRELMHKAANFILNRTKSSSFYTWRDNAETIADMRAKVAGFVARVANKEMSAAWEKWLSFLDDQEEARDAAERAMRWWVNKELHAAFDRWLEALEGARAMRSALRFFTHNEIFKAFEKWIDYVENKREHEENMRTALAHFANRALATAFTQWLDFCEECETTRRALSYYTNGTMLRALQTWSERVVEAGEERARMYKAVRFMQQGALRGAFARWEEFAVESAELREKLTRAVSRFANKTLFAAFAHWRGVVRDKAVAMEILQRALAKLRDRAKASAFERWAEVVEDLRRKEEVVGKILYKIMFRALCGAFERWLDFAAEKAKLRAKMKKAMARFRNRAESAAFSTWRGEVEKILEDRAAAAKAVGHFFLLAVRVAWRGWVAVVERRRENREFTTRALVLYAMNVQSKAFRHWRKAAKELAEIREKLGVAVRRMSCRALARAFSRWSEWLEDTLDMREKLAMALARMGNRAVNAAWNRWREKVEEGRAVKTAALKFFRVVKRKCFAEWVKYTITMLRVKQFMGNGLRRRAKHALRAWSKEATMAKVLRAKCAFLQQNSAAGVGRRVFRVWIATMRGVRHWRLRHSRWAFTAWLEKVRERKEEAMRETKLALVVKRLMFGNLARVFAGWRLIPQRNKRFFRKQQALKRVIAFGEETIKRKRKALVATAWRGWRSRMVDQEKLALVKKMLSKRLGAAKGTFLGRWRTYVVYRRAKLQRFTSAKEVYAKMRRRAAFARWVEVTRLAEAELELKLAKATEFAFGTTLAFTVNKWRALVAESRRKRMAMQRIAALLMGFGLENLALHVLRAWLEAVRESRRSAKRVFRADSHRRAKTLEATFLAWKVQSQPLREADYLKAILEDADSIWDRDVDDRGDPTELYAPALVRRKRAEFDGRDPDASDDDEAREDLEAIRSAARGPPASLAKGSMSRVRLRAASLVSSSVSTVRASAVDSDSDDDHAMMHRASRTPIGAGVGGRPSAQPPASGAVVGARFCGECGAKLAARQKFCSECGERL